MSGSSIQRHKQGILLHIGCGENPQAGFVGMDNRNFPKVDIVHDYEKFLWPIKTESVISIVTSHVIEHIKPWFMIKWMDECWRVLKKEGRLAITMCYGYSDRFLQDPTHCNPRNELTWTYFDPKFPLYQIYKPKPWKIIAGPFYQMQGDMEVLLEKANSKLHRGSRTAKA